MPRSIQEAAREACNGVDETLWQACKDIAASKGFLTELWDSDVESPGIVAEKAIRFMSPAERALYDISEEQ